MIRRLVFSVVLAFTALVVVAPFAGAQEIEGPYSVVAPDVVERPAPAEPAPAEPAPSEPAPVEPAPEPGVEAVGVTRPIDVADPALAATGLGTAGGLLLAVSLVAAGTGALVLARRYGSDLPT